MYCVTHYSSYCVSFQVTSMYLVLWGRKRNRKLVMCLFQGYLQQINTVETNHCSFKSVNIESVFIISSVYIES